MKFFYLGFSILFICLLATPISLTVFNATPKPLDVTENRVLAWPPKLKQNSLRNWPKRLDPWFQDHLAFRSHFVCLFLYLWSDILHAPVQEHFTGHKREWYSSLSCAPVLQNYLGLYPVTKENLTQFKLVQTGMYTFLKAQGIPYVVMLVPDKTTLYPEFLPFWTHWSKGITHYEQLSRILEDIGVPWIDMLSILKAKKSECILYNKKFDTVHWNGYGKQVGYQVLGDFLTQYHSGFVPKPAGEFYTITYDTFRTNRFTKERCPVLWSLPTKNVYEKKLGETLQIETAQPYTMFAPQFLVNKRPLTPYTIWFVSDSYFLFFFQEETDMELSPTFPLVYHTKNFFKLHNPDVTLPVLTKFLGTEYAPDIVIQTYVERLSNQIEESYDPFLCVIGELYFHTPGHILTPDNATHLIQNSNCTIIQGVTDDNERVIVSSLKHKPSFCLPAITTDNDGRAMFVTRIVSPVKTTAELYYKPQHDETRYNDTDVVKVDLQEGENFLHMFFFAEPNQTMELRFSPGCHSGEYHILSMPESIQTFQQTLTRES